jgi:hypothetical protein
MSEYSELLETESKEECNEPDKDMEHPIVS